MQHFDNCHSASVLHNKSSPVFMCAMVNRCRTKAAAGNFPRRSVVAGRPHGFIPEPSRCVFVFAPVSSDHRWQHSADRATGAGSERALTSLWGGFKQLLLAADICPFSHFFKETPVKSCLFRPFRFLTPCSLSTCRYSLSELRLTVGSRGSTLPSTAIKPDNWGESLKLSLVQSLNLLLVGLVWSNFEIPKVSINMHELTVGIKPENFQ